ncbi:Rdx family domain-containing protein [Trichoderma sp. SZMC 28013]
MSTSTSTSQPPQHAAVTAPLPRITIQFCTQCKWMLRAAYFAQELLSTFSLSLGEVALQPSTGGTFIVTIHHLSTSPASASSSTSPASVQSTTLWDRKTDGGFPETKELKRRVRDVIDPSRDLGHVDRHHGAAAAAPAAEAVPAKETVSATEQPAKQEQAPSQTSSTIVCEDCT